jgi:hypothetical protein
MRTVFGWVAAILVIVGTGVVAEGIRPSPADPFVQPCSGCSVRTWVYAYVGTPRTFEFPVIARKSAPPVEITGAWVPDPPAGLSSTVLAVKPGVYSLNCDRCPGDPRKNATDTSSLAKLPVTVQPGQYGELLLILDAHRVGTFSIRGFDVSWRAGGQSGSHFQPIGVTLYFDHTGPDPGLRSSMYGPS